jgi:hypothetical protein
LETLDRATFSQPADWVFDWSASRNPASMSLGLGRNETETLDRISVAEQHAILEQVWDFDLLGFSLKIRSTMNASNDCNAQP